MSIFANFYIASIAFRFEISHQTLIDLLIPVSILISTEFQRLSITHGGAAQVRTLPFFRHGGDMVRGCATSLPVLARR